MAAAIGNQYAAKAKVWSMAIARALAERSRVRQREALDDLAEKLLARCEEGDMAALKELGDRLDGKPVQAVAGADGEGPVSLLIQWAQPKSS
jgi:hypothetical protein